VVKVTEDFLCTATKVWHPVTLPDQLQAEIWLAPEIPAKDTNYCNEDNQGYVYLDLSLSGHFVICLIVD
jgi:hypothetical protein